MGQKISNWFREEPRHVFDVLKYSEKLSSIVGLSIYEFGSDPANGEVKLRPIKVVNFVAMNLLLMVVVLIHATIPYDVMNNGSKLVTYGIRTLLVVGVVGISGVTMMYARNWKRIVWLVQEVHQLDLKVTSGEYKQGYGTFLFVHIAIVLGFNIATLKHIDDRLVSWRMVFGQFYFNLVYFSIVSLFISFAYVISCRFVHFNHALRLRLDTTNGERLRSLLDGSKYRCGTVRERIRIVQKLAEMYHLLDAIADRMNGEFGDMYLVNIIATLQFSAFNVFALLKVYASDDARTRMFTVFNLSGSLYYTVMFMVLVSLSRTVSVQVGTGSKLTGTLLHKAMNNESSEELVRSMLAFSRQVRFKSAVIASKQVVIDWPFIFEVSRTRISISKQTLLFRFNDFCFLQQMVGVLVSYLVILLQFDSSIRSKQ
uniref:Gustatory receptor n=1 Tax=Anopheles dirus TaxID=7168 RepID=A0A182NR14_9DIPT